MMRIDVLTLFPDLFEPIFGTSMLARAQQSGEAELRAVDLRSFTTDKHRTADDVPYGGGAGMVLKAEPVAAAIDALRGPSTQVIWLTPQGKVYHQEVARRLSQMEHLILLCGHYEGVDERIGTLVDERLSIGDYVLTGGEAAAWVVTDSVVRLLPGVLKSGSLERESFDDGLLEGPQYTRPRTFRSLSVPEVLLSGNHEAIRRYRRKEALRRTLQMRPELLEKVSLSAEDRVLLFELAQERSQREEGYPDGHED